MAAIDFPNSPSVNDEFVVGDSVYVWTGSYWKFKQIAFNAALLSNANPLVSGTQNAGTSSLASRADHVHPLDEATRTPTTHAGSHGVAGSDAITVAQSQVTNLVSDLSNKVSTSGGSTITVSTGSTVPLTIQNNGTGNSFVVNDAPSDTTSFVINSSGSVGIGVSPATTFHVQGGRSTFSANSENFAIQVNNSSTANGPFIGSSGADTFNISTSGGVELFRIDSSGIIYDNGINEGLQQIAPDQFRYMGANASGITTVATNPFGVSPNLTAYGVYEFEYWLGLANSSTGAITLGWAGTSVTRLIGTVLVNPQANATAFTGVNPFINTTNKAITGGNSAATHWLSIRGFVVNGVSTQRLPLQVSVAAGTITPQAGSWFKFKNRGVSTSGTSDITYGNVA